MRHGAAALLLAAFAGCADTAPETAEIAVRDSAGVAIVENVDLSTLPMWTTDSDPITGIGVLEGDEKLQLFGVSGGLVLDDGRIVLLNGGTGEVRWYGPDGGFLTSQGRSGDGPGEYRRPSRLFRFGPDSLAVWDAALRRMAVLDDEGAFVRSVTFGSELLSPNALGAFPDRTIAVLDQRFDEEASSDGFVDLPGPVTTYSPDGESLGDTLSTARWITMQLFVSPGTVEGRGRGFEIGPSRALTQDGLWVGEPREPQVVLHGRDGAVRRIARWPDSDRTVTQEHKDAFLADRLASAPNDEVRQALRQSAADQPFAPILPAFRDVGADADGRLWVRAFDPPGVERSSPWWLFEADGRALRRVELPESAVLLWASGDRVLLRLRDELDVERVELRRLGPANVGQR